VSSFVVRSASDFFAYVTLFQGAPEAQRPAPAGLRSHLVGLLERFRQDAQARRVPEGEIEQARFALASWADEMILAQKWTGAEEWQRQPLQLQLFDTVRAGNEFYERLQRLKPGEDHALEIYYFCLVMGFQGELVTEPERRNALLSKLYEELYAKRRIVPALERGELSAPAYSWEFTDQQPGGRRVTPWLLGMLALTLGLYAVFWLSLRFSARDLVPFVVGSFG